MSVMNDEAKRTSPVEDHPSKPCWSANKKMVAVLRGEPLYRLSREIEVEARRLAAWRDQFLEHGKQGLTTHLADSLRTDQGAAL